MKTCSYCGRENEDNRLHCFECGTELLSVAPQGQPKIIGEAESCVFCSADNPAGRRACLICGNDLVAVHPESNSFQPDLEASELPELILEYKSEHGYSYPDWQKFWHQITASVPRSNWDPACRRAAREWVSQLCRDSGGNYHAYESRLFLLMCAEGQRASEALLHYAENSQEAISNQLGKLNRREVFGKQMLLAFSEDDDYYTYISHYYPDGTHNLSTGIFASSGGYGHIALPLRFVFSAKAVITHELVHNSLFHLRIPTWLNEGLAQRIERLLANRGFRLDQEMARRHRNFWDEESVQEFWAGTSFHKPGDSTQLSYSLGEILVELLAEDYVAFLDFVSEADWRDGGQDAAVRILDKDLGEVVGGFLGPGEWRPQRKKLSDLFKANADATDADPVGPGLESNQISLASNP